MMDGGGGWWTGGGSLLVIALFVSVVVMIVRQSNTNADPPHEAPRVEPRPRGAGDLLAERFACGEIGESEYRQRRDALRS